MKVIDLLNNIANGEEVPKKIKVNDKFEYEYVDGIDYKSENGKYLFDTYVTITYQDMNMEVEIIEDKKIEDLYIDKEFLLDTDDMNKKINEIINKHNMLVDKVNGE